MIASMSEPRSNRYRIRHRTWPALAIAFLLAACLDALAQTAVGTLSQVDGTPHVTRGAQTLPAAQGMAIDLLDKLTTDTSSTLTVTFDDNSAVQLSENSVLVIDQHVVSPRKTQVSL